MVFVTFHHADGAVEESGRIAAILPNLVVEPMSFQIRFIDHVEPEFVAQIKPIRIVGVMRSANGIDIETLHRDRIQPQRIPVESLALGIMVVMPVDSFDENAFAVDEQLAVTHFDGTKADASGSEFHSFALRVLERNHHRVEVRHLGRPQGWIP